MPTSPLFWLCAVVVIIGLAMLDARRRRMEIADRPHFTIEGNGEFEVEAVGESHYQPALRKIVFGKGYVREQFTAHLVCEDDNKHDRNAVRVEIVGSTVGYLPRASAAAYRGILAKNGLSKATGVAQAIIVGGGKDRPSYGVWLDM